MLHIVKAALAQKATDIHLVCGGDEGKIYFVIDGEMSEQREACLSPLSQVCGCFLCENSTEKFDPEEMQSGSVYDAFDLPLIVRFHTVPTYDPIVDSGRKKFTMFMKLIPQHQTGLQRKAGKE